MAIPIKNDNQLTRMREAGHVVAEVFALLKANIKPGISTRDLERLAVGHMRKYGAKPSFKGYRDFPGSICTSVNEEVIHGIPGIKKLKSGDIISIDVGVYLNGFHADAARTFPVGDVSPEALRLITVTRETFYHCIEYAKAGRHLHDISQAIQQYAEMFGYRVVEEYVGHGVGKDLHEEPQIPLIKQKNRGPRLCKGMTLAIEPMVNQGSKEIDTKPDNWTVVTKDGALSAHYENTVLITDGDPEILTTINSR
ncbi:MAG: type I methionyl aminopeptidase [Defluviitaleaceae bacterium]|nr:type I methionyl aminopeptidase [Defluviitaleaceae bacterium]